MAQTVKNLPAMRETWVRSLGLEDALDKGKVTHSSNMAWTIQSMGSQRVGHSWESCMFPALDLKYANIPRGPLFF